MAVLCITMDFALSLEFDTKGKSEIHKAFSSKAYTSLLDELQAQQGLGDEEMKVIGQRTTAYMQQIRDEYEKVGVYTNPKAITKALSEVFANHLVRVLDLSEDVGENIANETSKQVSNIYLMAM